MWWWIKINLLHKPVCFFVGHDWTTGEKLAGRPDYCDRCFLDINDWFIAIPGIAIKIRYHTLHLYRAFIDFLDCLKGWWGMRPQYVKCDYCGQKIWTVGSIKCPVYCSEGCAYHDNLDYVIPF